MINLLTFILLLSLLFLVGFLISSFLSKNFIEKIGLTSIFGTVFTTYLFFTNHAFFNIALDSFHLFSLLIISNFILLILYNKFLPKVKIKHEIKTIYDKFLTVKANDTFSFFCLMTLLVVVIHTFVQNIYWPLYDWDALALYDFRAKVFAYTHSMASGVELGYFYHYPPYTSILHSFNYLVGVSHARIWYSILYSSLLLVFYYILRKKLTLRLSILGTFLLAICPGIYGHAFVAYTNLAYSIFTALGFLYFILWLEDGDKKELLKGALLIGFSTWVRTSEPFWLAAFIVFAIGLLKYPKQFIWISISGLIVYYFKYPWAIYISKIQNTAIAGTFHAIKTINFDGSVFGIFDRFRIIFIFLKQNVFPIHKVYALPILLSLYSAVHYKEKHRIWEFTIFATLVGIIILGTFLFSYLFPGWQEIPDSAARMSMVLYPITIYIIMNSKFWNIDLTKKIKQKK